MFMEERLKEIAEAIEKNGKITIAEITAKYGISDESARRDLSILAKKKLCNRVYGGALKPIQIGIRPPADRQFDKMTVFDNYREIAKRAANEIKENDIVYLCGGSFGYIMLSFLPKDIHYTIVSNTVDIGKELRSFDNIDIYIAGGKMRQSGSIVDSLATEFVSRLHFDLCFLTGAGLTAEFGLSNGTDETATFQRAIIKNSRKKILLLPSSKIGCDSFIKVCEANEFTMLITDWDRLEEHIGALEDKGLEVIIVEEPQ